MTICAARNYSSVSAILANTSPTFLLFWPGDLNLDITRATASSEVNVAQFRNEFAGQSVRTTPPKSLFDRGSVIDWIFTRGPLRAKQPQVHNRVSASDHYPLSITLTFA